MQKIIFQGNNIKLNPETKEYVRKKLKKFANLISSATSIAVNIRLINPSNKGGESYKVEITIKMPRAFIKVEDHGSVINTVVDKLESPLKQRLERFQNKYRHWEKGENWKSVAIDLINEGDILTENTLPNDFLNYAPAIKHKYYDEDRPLHPAEAIEQMELLGHDSFLFKNIESNQYAMIYRRKNGGYGLVEPRK